MVLLKNAKHACCIVSFFNFNEARAVLHYNGVKTNISPRVLQHAENIVNNPLLVRSEKNTSFHDWKGTQCLQGQTRRGFASQPSGTEAREERIPEWDVPGRRTRVCPLPGGKLWLRQFTPGIGAKRTLTLNAGLIPRFHRSTQSYRRLI